MTVSSATNEATFSGNGVTQIFPLPFRFFSNSDIIAQLVDESAGTASPLSLNTDYTLSGAGDPEVDGNATGVLTMLSPVAVGFSLFVRREIPLTQPTDIINQGRFFPEIHETVFDRLLMQIQQGIGSLGKALRVVPSEPNPAFLPLINDRANRLLSFDSSGNPIAVAPASGDASELAIDLANSSDPAKGAGMVGWARAPLSSAITTAAQMLSAQLMNIWEFAWAITSKPDPLNPETWDWAPAFQAAFDVGGGLFVPQARYPVRGVVTATKALRLLGLGHSLSVIVPDIGSAGTKVFAFETNDVSVEGIHVNGAGLATASSENKYAFFGGDGSTKFKRHSYRNCAITGWNFKGDSTKENLIVAHGFYIDNVDDVVIEHNVVNGMSGCAIFLRDNSGITVTQNNLHNSAWYPIHVAGGMFAGEISHNVISCDLATGIYWGGAIDLMNQHIPLETRSNGVHIFGNDISGVISYGAAIRILSCENVSCYENKIHDWSIGTWSTSGGASAIRVDTRGTAVGAENGPCRNIHIQRNRAEAPSGGTSNQGVYVSNQFQSARNPTSGVWVQDNDLISLDAARAFTAGVIFHGFDGGIEDVYVDGNRVVTMTGGSSAVSGAIGFVATSAQGRIDRVFIGKNDVSDIGTPTGSTQIGVSIGANTDNVLITSPSIIRNFYVGLRAFAGSGPSLYRLSDFVAIACTLKTILATEETDLFGTAPVPSIASSSALAIPIFEGPRKTIKVTGSTTINSCAAQNHKGQSVSLVFEASVLVNDTNQLKLAGAFNATSGSTLTVTSDGTNWYELGRSVN